MGEYAQLLWMVPLAAAIFYLLRRKAIKDAREKYTRKLIRQRIKMIREENERWAKAGKQTT